MLLLILSKKKKSVQSLNDKITILYVYSLKKKTQTVSSFLTGNEHALCKLFLLWRLVSPSEIDFLCWHSKNFFYLLEEKLHIQ